MKTDILYKGLTSKVIRCFYNVYNELGSGFLESVYENSLMIELKEMGLSAESQKGLNVFYKNELVGEFRADIIVEEKILIEIKAVSALSPLHKAQLINYLRITGIRVGLLMNFGPEPKFNRIIY